MSYPQIIQLQPATAADELHAFEEVKHFGYTDMGRGEDFKWAYRILQEADLAKELSRLASPTSHGPRTDSVTFQPCQTYEARSQDRYDIRVWSNEQGTWTFTGLFDGQCRSVF